MRHRIARTLVTVAVLASTATIVATTASQASTLSPSTNGCDVLVTVIPGHDCMLPWPNNAFTKSASTPTHRQLAITAAETPATNKGQHFSPASVDAADGFSPGSMIMTYVPGLSLANSKIAISTDIALSLSPTAPIILRDMTTNKDVAYFAELDALNTNSASQLLLVHPATALTEGHRFAVVLRNLKNTSDTAIAPAATTVAALHGTLTPKSRGAYIKNLIDVELHSVLGSTVPYMAWDFTVESEMSIAGPALAMRDSAYKTLTKTSAPPFTVATDTTNAGVTTVTGTYQVPLFLRAATNSALLDTNAKGVPIRNGTKTWPANFICVFPSTLQGGGPALPAVYGHGLLGDASEVEGGNFADKVSHDMMGCATDWLGLDDNDLPEVLAALGNLSDFNVLSDQMLQGILNFQFLGRLINSPDGFASSSAFKSDGHVLFQVGKCVYVGYSQGAIMGAAESAISNEWTRAFLGQGGMDYAGLLLERSSDWPTYASYLDTAYPNTDDQQIALQLAQILWDRGEADGYAQHLTSHPYPGTKAKDVFLVENYGDHQVPNVGTEMLARTIGAAEYDPAFERVGDQYDYALAFGLKKLTTSAPTTSALEMWNFGTLDPPTENLPPPGTSGDGADPHNYGRGLPALDLQIIAFLKTGIVGDLCGALACTAPPG